MGLSTAQTHSLGLSTSLRLHPMDCQLHSGPGLSFGEGALQPLPPATSCLHTRSRWWASEWAPGMFDLRSEETGEVEVVFPFPPKRLQGKCPLRRDPHREGTPSEDCSGRPYPHEGLSQSPRPEGPREDSREATQTICVRCSQRTSPRLLYTGPLWAQPTEGTQGGGSGNSWEDAHHALREGRAEAKRRRDGGMRCPRALGRQGHGGTEHRAPSVIGGMGRCRTSVVSGGLRVIVKNRPN